MEIQCPACGSGAAIRLRLVKQGYPIRECSSCGHLFVWPVPSREEIEKLYSFGSGYQVRDMIQHAQRTRFPPKIERNCRLLREHAPGPRMLEVGCSDGTLLYLAQKAGMEVQGVELNPDTAKIAEANGFKVHRGTLETAGLASGSFDAVVLGDLIEHVPAPGRLLQDVHRVLVAGGIVLIVTPNHEAFLPRATWILSKLTGIPWSHPTPPFHLQQFGARSLKRLLQNHGFEVTGEHYRPASFGYEIRQTGLPSAARRAARNRAPLELTGYAAASAAALASYGLIFLLDRLLFWKRRDFEMTMVALRRDG